MILVENLKKIYKAVENCNNKVFLIAASKTQTSDTIDEFMRLAPNFILGENRVQELLQKYNPNYKWHLIGQLQTNKVKYIIDKVELIHSLDRDELAKEIEKQATKHGKIQNCLVEINMGAEISKGGLYPDETLAFIERMKAYPHIKIEGIMAVMPNLDDRDKLECLYDKLYQIYEQAKAIKQENVEIKYMSAGMSNDYEIALEHGANMIRLGRFIFGERVYPTKQE